MGAVLVTGLLLIWAPAASAQPTKPPPMPVLLEPIGVISTIDPAYTWETAGSFATGDVAEEYRVWVRREFDVPGEDRIVFDTQFIMRGAICGQQEGSRCAVQLGALTPGTHTWYVQARNPAGFEFWSAGLGFVVP